MTQLLAAITISVVAGVIRPVVTSLITQRAERNEQGVVLGLTQSLTSVAQITAPLIAGAMIQKGWLAAWALVIAAVSLVGVAIPTPRVPARVEV